MRLQSHETMILLSEQFTLTFSKAGVFSSALFTKKKSIVGDRLEKKRSENKIHSWKMFTGRRCEISMKRFWFTGIYN